ncbi:VRR-NUC domain-containing protein [Paracidovorax citrulli]|nr:VRR-NUC domain-containing protein [Paracidovorax citrulli]
MGARFPGLTGGEILDLAAGAQPTEKPKRESEVEAALVKRVEAAGGLAWKFTSPGRRGVPDRVVMLPGRAPEFVELKRKGQRPRPDQLRQHERLRAAGAVVHVIDDDAGIDRLLEKRS